MDKPFLPGTYDELATHFGDPHQHNFAAIHIVASTFCGHAIECHRLIKPILEAVEDAIEAAGIENLVHTVDGCFVVRNIRGGTKPSLHSYGLALDLNAELYPLGSLKRQDARLVKAFHDQRFFNGADFHHRKDPQHFQFTRPNTI